MCMTHGNVLLWYTDKTLSLIAYKLYMLCLYLVIQLILQFEDLITYINCINKKYTFIVLYTFKLCIYIVYYVISNTYIYKYKEILFDLISYT